MSLACVLTGAALGSVLGGFLKQLFLGLRDTLEGREVPDRGPGLSDEDVPHLVPGA